MTPPRSRNDLVATLRRYRLSSPDRSEVADQMITFVEGTPECAERAHPVGHLTGSGWVVNRSWDKALLLHHKKLEKWLQLGGHADGEFDLLRVALREVCEESGLSQVVPVSSEVFDIDIHDISPVNGMTAHLHFDVRFLLTADEEEPIVSNHESKGVLWVPLSEVVAYTSEESVLRMVRLTTTWRERYA